MKNYFDVAGKYAVVTGASSGLGRQFALCRPLIRTNTAAIKQIAE